MRKGEAMKLLGHHFEEGVTSNYRTVLERIKKPYSTRQVEVVNESILMEVSKDYERFSLVLITDNGILIDTGSMAKYAPRACYKDNPGAFKQVTEKEWSEVFGTEETE